MRVINPVNCLSFGAFAASLALSSSAFALTSLELEAHIEKSLSGPLPITLVGPLSYNDVTVTDEDGTFTAVLSGVTYGTSGDGAALGDITITASEVSDGVLSTRVALPKAFKTGDTAYSFDSHSLFGTWQMADQTYTDMDYQLSGLSVTSGGGKAGSVEGMVISLSPYAEGSQKLDISFETVAMTDSADDQLFSVEPSQLNMDITSPTPTKPYLTLRNLINGLVEFQAGDLSGDPASAMQLFRGLAVPFSDATVNSTLGTVTYRNGLEDVSFSVDGGLLNFGYADYLDGSNGSSSAVARFTGLQFRSPDAAGVISEFEVSGESDGMNGPFAFEFSEELYAKVLDETAEINLGELFDLYFNFDNASVAYGLKGISAKLPDGESFELDGAKISVALNDARTDEAELVILLDETEFASSQFSDAVTSAVLPQLVDMNIAIQRLPLASLRAALAEDNINASMAIGNEEEIASMFQEIGFKLLGIMMLNAPSIVVENSSIDTASISFDLDGLFNVDPASPRFVSGSMDIVASGVAELQEIIQTAMTSDDSAAKKFAVPALTGLGVAQGFGKPTDDGGLLFALEVTPEGDLTVNGAPLPLP